jgi:uncharacterized membrane protein YagU involved in acid resistance
MGLALLYAVLKRRFPAIEASKGSGALYGIGTFIVLDEIINPMLGVANRPSGYPWQRHARELTTHLIYGIVMNAALRRLERQWNALDDTSLCSCSAGYCCFRE